VRIEAKEGPVLRFEGGPAAVAAMPWSRLRRLRDPAWRH